MAKYSFGIDKTTGEELHVTEVGNGGDCNCRCPYCGKDFRSFQGGSNEWHFRHIDNEYCSYGPEYEIHIHAKRELKRLKRIMLPCISLPNGENQPAVTVTVEDVLLENHSSSKVPDVKIIAEGRELLLVVTNRKTKDIESRKRRLRESGFDAIGIGLDDYNFCSYQSSDMENLLLGTDPCKHWVCNQQSDAAWAKHNAERERIRHEREAEQERIRCEREAERERAEREKTALEAARLAKANAELSARKEYEEKKKAFTSLRDAEVNRFGGLPDWYKARQHIRQNGTCFYCGLKLESIPEPAGAVWATCPSCGEIMLDPCENQSCMTGCRFL